MRCEGYAAISIIMCKLKSKQFRHASTAICSVRFEMIHAPTSIDPLCK